MALSTSFFGVGHAFRTSPQTVYSRGCSCFGNVKRVPLRISAQAVPTDFQQSLKDELLEEIYKLPEAERNGKPSAGVQELLDKLKQVAESGEAFEVQPSAVNGSFRGLLNSTALVAGDGSTTLGTLTFQQFGPQDLKVVMASDVGELYQGASEAKEYAIRTGFKVAEGKHEGLIGLGSVEGYYEADPEKAERQIIHFTSLKLEPIDKSAEGVQAWLELTKTSNPTMDDNGIAKVTLPQPIKGHRDLIYLDNETQVSIGNRGSFVVAVKKED